MYLLFCVYIQTILTRIVTELQGFLYHNYRHRTVIQPTCSVSVIAGSICDRERLGWNNDMVPRK